MRPAPEWVGASPGVAEPVSRKRPGVRSEIDRAADDVPGHGQALPLVDEDRGCADRQSGRLGLGDGTLARIVEPVNRGGTALGGGGLANALGTLDRDRGQARQELIELIIRDSAQVVDHLRSHLPGLYAPIHRNPALPDGRCQRTRRAVRVTECRKNERPGCRSNWRTGNDCESIAKTFGRGVMVARRDVEVDAPILAETARVLALLG